MKSIIKNFENIFAAVAFAEGSEFTMAVKIMEELHVTGAQRPHSNKKRVERLKPLRAHK